MNLPTSLYRMFNCAGDLLYVGIAGNPGRRFQQHRSDKPWWPEVSDIQLEHFPSRNEASIAETHAIHREGPRYNILGNVPQIVQRERVKYIGTPAPLSYISWVCDVCSQEIRPPDGVLHIDNRSLQVAADSCPDTGDVVNAAEIESWRCAKWTAVHCRCAPDRAGYEIDLTSLRSVLELLDWTGHLLGKSWLHLTDWPDLVRQILGAVEGAA